MHIKRLKKNFFRKKPYTTEQLICDIKKHLNGIKTNIRFTCTNFDLKNILNEIEIQNKPSNTS